MLLLGAPLVAMRVRRKPHGFLPMAVIRNGKVVRSAVAAASIPASWFALLIGVPAVLVNAGWEPWEVGLLLVPSAVVAMLVPRFAGPLLDRIGGSWSLAVSGVVAALTMLLAALGTQLVAPVPVAIAVALATVSFGLGQPALTALVGDAVHADVRGVALGIATLLFLVGGSVGSAVVAGLGEVIGIPPEPCCARRAPGGRAPRWCPTCGGRADRSGSRQPRTLDGMTTPALTRTSPSWGQAGVWSLGFVAVLWVAEIVDTLLGNRRRRCPWRASAR